MFEVKHVLQSLQNIALYNFQPAKGEPLLSLNSFHIISLQQVLEYQLLQREEVFTIKDCMQEDHLFWALLIEDREVPNYVWQESMLPVADSNGHLYSSQMSPDFLWRVIKVV
ncbi:hypothetical protein AVEN_190634-1 [Araneus ventricosus]|uniref:Uncharacterized protein n=1 Tax=Araneus ventricosus TaxID=182803 RepID=A0A4Y2I2L7_ARAVE|nr:hypothetical protein AVEN_190634-1 [Araneus ventricosus]